MEIAELVKQMSDNQDRQTKVLEALVSKQLHTKAPATDATYNELHGVGSLFGDHPVERDIISAHISPQGIGAYLPWLPSVYEQPHFASITGFTATNGAEPDHACADAPTGYMKSCILTAAFGRLMRDTQTIDIDKTVRRANRGDFTDLVLRGNILGELNGWTPGGLNSEQILNIVTKNEMVIAAVAIQRLSSTMTWTGNPAAGNGRGYIPFPGLDRQIATGQMDAESGTLCPALDSDVKDFAWDNIEGNGRSIVEYIQMLEYYIFDVATRTGALPAKWVWVMRPELWMVLSQIWPCLYSTNRCANVIAANANQGNTQVVLMGPENIKERDAMRNGMYLDVNGRRYPVVVDDGIFEFNVTNDGHCLAGEYASSIYFVPETAFGGLPITYFEHVDYRQIDKELPYLNGKERFWSDDGRFMWAYEDVGGFCYKLKLKIEPRIVLRAPQLAGRIDHVKYVPLQHLRSSDPSNTYFRDGGVSQRPDATHRHVW